MMAELSETTPRDELEDRARELGVPDPEGLPNKRALLDAIEIMTPNPALTPEPVEPVEQTYRVIGPRVVHDTRPGDTFTALLTPEHEHSLTVAGHIIRTTEPEGT